jgi:peptidoglycan/LPS O-acetylase OafA/YrhL
VSTNREISTGAKTVNPRPPRLRMTTRTIEQAFDPRNNALNAWRLVMATGVILCHSWPLTGRHVSFEPAHQLLRDVWVDGFFAMSGFLITWSWFRHPVLRTFFLARGLRILPGLWVCLVITAFVIAPVGVLIQGGAAGKLLLSLEPIKYVLSNSGVMMLKTDVGGTPEGVPWPGQWDGSLWTLAFELLCYIAIAALGVVGLLRRRWLIPALLALTLWWSASLGPTTGFAEEPPIPGRPIDPAAMTLFIQQSTARFAVMFFAGALLYQLRNVLPARWSLAAISVVIVLASSLLPNYRLVAAVPLAYALIVSGALIRTKWLNLRTDLSYGVYIYAWPIQQLLVICGLAFLNPFVFAIVAALATLPMAALSWFVVEKPALALKSRLLGMKDAVEPAIPGTTREGRS